MTRLANTEHDEQVALFEMIAMQRSSYPELGLIFAIPNGGKRPRGEAGKLKAEGVQRGVPDLFVPVQRWHAWWGDVPGDMFGGLFIEMKVGRNKLTYEQKTWLDALSKQVYATAVCYSWRDAWNVICKYLRIEERSV